MSGKQKEKKVIDLLDEDGKKENSVENPSTREKLRAFFKLENIFKSNKTVFLFSLIIAIGMWIAFVALDTNYEVNVTIYNVPITATLGKGAEDMGLRVFGGENMFADVVVSGRQYDLQKISAQDIQLTAQPSPVTGAGTYSTVISKRSNSPIDFNIVNVEPKEVNVIVDRYVEGRSFDVSVEHDSINVPDGYILDAAHPSADTVTISGPETEINRISRVVARADNVTEMLNKTTSFDSTYQFYDSSDMPLQTEMLPNLRQETDEQGVLYLKLKPRDLTIAVRPANMQVIVPVYQQKTIDVSVNLQNAPEDITDISFKIEPSNKLKVRIPTDEPVQELNEIKLNVDFSSILDTPTKLQFPIDQLQIPASYKLEDDIKAFVVLVTVKNKASTLINVENIHFADESASSDFSIVSARIENVRVVGNTSVISAFASRDIIALAELPDEEVTADQVEVPVHFKFSDKSCWIYNNSKTVYKVTLQRKVKSP